MTIRKSEALAYHLGARPGKIEVTPTKPCRTQRDLSLANSWKLAGAALMPGALLMTAAILFYGLGALDLVQLAAAVGAHLVAGWVYLIWTVWVFPKLSPSAAKRENPFASKAACEE